MIHQNNNHNPLTHFFNLHSAASASGDTYRSEPEMTDEEEEIDVDDSVNINNHHSPSKCHEEHTELDTQKSSFTIAAILGLKAAAAAHSHTMNEGGNVHSGGFKPNYTSTIIHPNLAAGQRPFNDVMNLTLSSSLMQSPQQHPKYNQAPSAFLASTFQHHHHHPSAGSALQNLQKLHQQHVSNSLGHCNGFRLMNRSSEMNKSKSQTSLKSKRVRTIFTPEQLERLEAEFERQQYMVGPERLYLAHTLQLTEAQVKVWFQNRRIKWRKHHLELTQQRLAVLRTRQIPGSNVSSSSPGPATQQATVSDSEDVTALSTDSRDSNI